MAGRPSSDGLRSRRCTARNSTRARAITSPRSTWFAKNSLRPSIPPTNSPWRLACAATARRAAHATRPGEISIHQSLDARRFSTGGLAAKGSSAEGREAFAAAQCVRCHRAANEPGPALGPDLTGVSARFGRRELLEHIFEPSKTIDDKFRNVIVTLKDQTTYIGAIDYEDDAMLALSSGAGSEELIEISKAQIATRAVSDQSPMPAGLLNILNKEQIRDLLAYLESGPAAGGPVPRVPELPAK